MKKPDRKTLALLALLAGMAWAAGATPHSVVSQEPGNLTWQSLPRR
jgi:hypothetical protein